MTDPAGPGSTRRQLFGGLLAAGGVAAVGAAGAAGAEAAAPPPVPGALNVRDFGAIGDGVADDTGALRAAIAAAYRGYVPVTNTNLRDRVYLPAGVYRITDSIELSYGITLEGAAPSTTIIRLELGAGAAPKDMFVADPDGFAVAIHFVGLTLDGGFDFAGGRNAALPSATGSAVLAAGYAAGESVRTLSLRRASVPIEFGDVLRIAGQPSIVSRSKGGSSAEVAIAEWAPATRVSEGAAVSIYKAGSLVRGLGRLHVDNCSLMNAVRHCLEGDGGRITRSDIGWSQGCGMLIRDGGDSGAALCWFSPTGAANIYLVNAYDFSISQCLVEGGAGANIQGDSTNVTVIDSNLWGGRLGNVLVNECGDLRMMMVKVRDPGTGGTQTNLSSVAWPRPAPRSAIGVDFVADPAVRFGAMLTNVVMSSCADESGQDYACEAMVHLRRTDPSRPHRSSLSQIEAADDIRFVKATISGASANTFLTACRGTVDVAR